MTTHSKLALTTAVFASLSLAIAPAFAQSGTGAEGSPGGAGHGGDSGTGAPLTAGGSNTTVSGSPMTKSSTVPGAGTGESKMTGTGGQPGGRADKN